MSWWTKAPVTLGADPSFDEVGMAGFLAWIALMAIDGREDFGGRIPRKYATPKHLSRQFPDDADRAMFSRGIDACIEHELVTVDDNGNHLLEAELYERWRGPKSEARRKREYRASRAPSNQSEGRKSQDAATTEQVSQRYNHERDMSHCVPLCPIDVQASPDTRPDQTRPDQTRESLRGRSGTPARDGPPQDLFSQRAGPDIGSPAPEPVNGSEVTRVANHFDATGRAVAKETGHRWRSRGQAGWSDWTPLVRENGESACIHAIDMLAAQARERARQNQRNALEFLRRAWAPDVFRRAVVLPDRETAIAEATPFRLGKKGASIAPATREEFAADQAKIKCSKTRAERAKPAPVYGIYSDRDNEDEPK